MISQSYALMFYAVQSGSSVKWLLSMEVQRAHVSGLNYLMYRSNPIPSFLLIVCDFSANGDVTGRGSVWKYKGHGYITIYIGVCTHRTI